MAERFSIQPPCLLSRVCQPARHCYALCSGFVDPPAWCLAGSACHLFCMELLAHQKQEARTAEANARVCRNSCAGAPEQPEATGHCRLLLAPLPVIVVSSGHVGVCVVCYSGRIQPCWYMIAALCAAPPLLLCVVAAPCLWSKAVLARRVVQPAPLPVLAQPQQGNSSCFSCAYLFTDAARCCRSWSSV